MRHYTIIYKSVSDLQTLIKHSFLLYFPRELLMSFLNSTYTKLYNTIYATLHNNIQGYTTLYNTI